MRRVRRVRCGCTGSDEREGDEDNAAEEIGNENADILLFIFKVVKGGGLLVDMVDHIAIGTDGLFADIDALHKELWHMQPVKAQIGDPCKEGKDDAGEHKTVCKDICRAFVAREAVIKQNEYQCQEKPCGGHIYSRPDKMSAGILPEFLYHKHHFLADIIPKMGEIAMKKR